MLSRPPSSPLGPLVGDRGETDTSERGRYPRGGGKMMSRKRSSRSENDRGPFVSSRHGLGFWTGRPRRAYAERPGEYINEKADVAPVRGTDSDGGGNCWRSLTRSIEDEEYERELNKKRKSMQLDEEDSAIDGQGEQKLEAGPVDDHVPPAPDQPTPRAVDMLQGCRSVDEFEQVKIIGEGTYGVVYRARNKKTGEIVALKKVKKESEKEGFPLSSLREINTLFSLHHPAVVDVKEVVVGSTINGVFPVFVVMEYVERDLQSYMQSMKQPFSLSEVKCLLLQLFGGVKYLHDNWVLHRDLKTSNLLLNKRGELKICDFGMARQYESPLKAYTSMVVTLWYRAPELLLGQENYKYSTAVDMWSLGCIMAEILAKEPLFDGNSEIDQIDKICRILGTPNGKDWPEFPRLPSATFNFVRQPYSRLRERFHRQGFLEGGHFLKVDLIY
ncbi:unnamed protein product [Calypogeia fissa]